MDSIGLNYLGLSFFFATFSRVKSKVLFTFYSIYLELVSLSVYVYLCQNYGIVLFCYQVSYEMSQISTKIINVVKTSQTEILNGGSGTCKTFSLRDVFIAKKMKHLALMAHDSGPGFV